MLIYYGKHVAWLELIEQTESGLYRNTTAIFVSETSAQRLCFFVQFKQTDKNIYLWSVFKDWQLDLMSVNRHVVGFHDLFTKA